MNNLNMGNLTQKWVEVLFPYLEDYFNKFTASEISRKTKLPQQTTSRILNNLVKLKLLNYESKGKNKYFYLDKNKREILLNVLESQKSLYFQLENKFSLTISEILNFSEGIILFGSYASGKNKSGSDMDLIILGKSNFVEIKKIKEKQPIDLNEHYFSYSEFEKLIKNKDAFGIEILKNHILFGNVSKIVKIFLREKNE